MCCVNIIKGTLDSRLLNSLSAERVGGLDVVEGHTTLLARVGRHRGHGRRGGPVWFIPRWSVRVLGCATEREHIRRRGLGGGGRRAAAVVLLAVVGVALDGSCDTEHEGNKGGRELHLGYVENCLCFY